MPDQGSNSGRRAAQDGVFASETAPDFRGTQRKLEEARAKRQAILAQTERRSRSAQNTSITAPSDTSPMDAPTDTRHTQAWRRSYFASLELALTRLLLLVTALVRDLAHRARPIWQRTQAAISKLKQHKNSPLVAVVSLCATFFVLGYLMGQQTDAPHPEQVAQNAAPSIKPQIVGEIVKDTTTAMNDSAPQADGSALEPTDLAGAKFTSALPQMASMYPTDYSIAISAPAAPVGLVSQTLDVPSITAAFAQPPLEPLVEPAKLPAPAPDKLPGPSLDGALLPVKVFAPGSVADDMLNGTLQALEPATRAVVSVERVAFSISSPHIRYYYPEDREQAETVASLMGVELRNFEHVPNGAPGIIDYWMSGRAATQP